MSSRPTKCNEVVDLHLCTHDGIARGALRQRQVVTRFGNAAATVEICFVKRSVQHGIDPVAQVLAPDELLREPFP